MGVSSTTYQRYQTGNWARRECCPANGNARATAQKSVEEMMRQSLPPSRKLAVDVSQADYTVPDFIVDYVQGITVNTSGLVNIQLLNDETSDLVYVTQGIFLRCQVYQILSANTAAGGIRIWA